MSFGQSGFLPNANEAAPTVKANLSDAGVLTINGTSRRDKIEIFEATVLLSNDIRVQSNGRTIFSELEPRVKSIVVNALGGNDLVKNLAFKNSIIRGGNGNDVIVGGQGKDELRGQAGNDNISDVSGFNRIFGDDGNDILTGGKNIDEIRGGKGNDRIKGGDGKDRLYGDAGNDRLEGQAGDDDVHGGDDNDTLQGGDDSDLLVGDDGNDKLYGEEGDDILDGLAGNDLLYGADGKDYLKGGVGNDLLDGGNQDDEGYGGDGADKLYAGDGNDMFFGEDGEDVLFGSDGNDRLEGGSDDDKLYGEAGNDLLVGGNDNDYLIGHTGADDLRGSAGNDTLEADDPLSKDSSIDKLFGETGVDTLYGSFGLDVLSGGLQAGDRERTRFFVDTTSDVDDSTYTNGNLSFREATFLANADDIITFAQLTAASAKTINVVNGAYVLTSDVTIQGVGSAGRLTFDGSDNMGRFMNIIDGAKVLIENVVIREFNAGGGDGGAIFLDNGNLTLRNVVGRQNSAVSGGFLYMDGDDTTARIELSSILVNNATDSGGGLLNNGGSLVVDRTTLDGNTSTNVGGGVYSKLSTSETRIISSTLSNNQSTSSYGGGIRHEDGALSIVNSTLSGNLSSSDGAAIDASLSATSTLSITNSTIVFNTAAANGAGLYINGTDEATINNTIIFGNKNGAVDLDFDDASGVNEGQSFNNWIGVATNTTFVNGTDGNHVGVLVGLDATLTDNGGPTKTHKLSAGSGAINAGNNAKAVDWLNATLAFDQTGKTRKVGSAVDIGAFEFQA